MSHTVKWPEGVAAQPATYRGFFADCALDNIMFLQIVAVQGDVVVTHATNDHRLPNCPLLFLQLPLFEIIAQQETGKADVGILLDVLQEGRC